MDIKIPFESVLNFKTNVCEITKMSLEHEFTLNDHIVLGNFIVSGEYKSHHISVNTDPFKFLLPFQVDLDDDINLDTVVLDIEDFTYDINDDRSIKVNITYQVKAELQNRNDDLFKAVIDVDFDEEISHLDEITLEPEEEIAFLDAEEEEERKNDELIEEPEEQILEDLQDEEVKAECEELTNNEAKEVEIRKEKEVVIEEKKEEDMIEEKEREEVKNIEIKEEKEEVVEEKFEEERKIAEADKSAIIESINAEEDTFVTYHVHIVKESESVEAICAMYKINQMSLSEYNDLSDIKIGDKIIIPCEDE